MADRYGDLYDRMVAVMDRLDPDATVAAYCRERALPVPADIEPLVELHLKAVDAWLDTLAASGPA